MCDDIRICDIISDCTDCPLFAKSCDGRPDEEDTNG